MSSSKLRWAGRLDMYRKIPTDLMEGSRRGSTLSYIAAAVMLMLFLLETKSYFSKTYVFLFAGKGLLVSIRALSQLRTHILILYFFLNVLAW